MNTHSNRRVIVLLTVGALAATAFVAGCGDDEVAKPVPVAATDTTADNLSTLALEATDFSFGDVPRTVPAGTRLVLTNRSPVEVHEAVVFRLAGGDVRPVDEILASASDPAAIGEFAGVAVALPGQEAAYPEGPVVFDQPGRYVIACFVPTGADPKVYADAMQTGEAPTGLTGVPHLAHGMVAEVTVR